jgi:peptidoglycan/LPS O-acetylase OafA/YrhL
MRKFIQQLPQRLTRITSGGKIIREIDGLRFLAIIPVIMQHMYERFERNTTISFVPGNEKTVTGFFASRGFIGVYIFFIISGFILALPFAKHRFADGKKVNVGQYFLRRVTRLEPTYILWITVFFIIFVIHGHNSFATYLPHYLASITYTHGLIYHMWSPINPPTWTLEIEIQFYILAPLLAWLFFSVRNKMKRRLINLFAILLLIIVQQYFKFYTNPYNLTILGHLHYFLAGFMLADVYLCDWREIKRSRWYDIVAITALAIVLISWSWNFEFSLRLIFLISLFVLFFAVFKGVAVNQFITNRWVTAIGGMCYTIYLIHLPMEEFLIVLTKKIHVSNYLSVNLLIQLLIAVPIVLIVSSVFFLLFEKPFMDKDWPRKLSARVKNVFLKPNL